MEVLKPQTLQKKKKKIFFVPKGGTKGGREVMGV